MGSLCLLTDVNLIIKGADARMRVRPSEKIGIVLPNLGSLTDPCVTTVINAI
jgi:hypothetical protein